MTAQFDSAQAVAAALGDHPVSHLIDGELSREGELVDVIDPATGKPAAQAPSAGPELLDRAVAAARRAQPAWAALPVEERRRFLLALSAKLREHADELAGIVTLEQGKPIAASRFEVERAASMQEDIVSLDLDDEMLRSSQGTEVDVRYRPLGVVGAITPWNMPIGLAIPCFTHALYTGNTLVLKPSPYTPLSVLRIGELVKDLFPAGVVNVVNGGDAFGRAMTEHPGIDKISFTGSVPTGQRVMAASASTLKRVTLELGGNDAAIIMPGSPIEDFAASIFRGAFINTGQVCMSIKRLYVHASQHDALVSALVRLANEAKLGSGFDPATTLGPVQNRAQFDVVRDLIADSRKHGKIAAGGNVSEEGGYFIEPTILTGIGHGTRLVDEEAFGPILPVMAYDEVDDAVRLANDSPYGLGGSVWGGDVDEATAVAARLSAGTVWVNHHVGADPLVPFGGLRSSGIGCQFGVEGLKEYLARSAIVTHKVLA